MQVSGSAGGKAASVDLARLPWPSNEESHISSKAT